MPKLGFIGAGNMAGAIIKGLDNQKAQHQYQINIYDIDLEKTKALTQTVTATAYDNIKDLVANSDIIILAVKPHNAAEILPKLKQYHREDLLYMSVLAGVPLKVYEEGIANSAWIRVMPNTSAAAGLSATGLTIGKNINASQKALAQDIFEQVGQAFFVDEPMMDAVAALSGSGPAYYYLFTEYLAMAGEKLGLEKDTALALAKLSLIGAGNMVHTSGKSPEQLRIEVTSPKGSTLAALDSFRGDNLQSIAENALKAAFERNKAMGEEAAKAFEK